MRSRACTWHLLVDAEDDRPLGRRGVEPDDVADLLHEQRIGRKLEGLDPVRLQAERRQMRCTVEGAWPISLAMVLRLQCVLPLGRVSRVLLARQRRQFPPLHIIENDLDSATLAHSRLQPNPTKRECNSFVDQDTRVTYGPPARR